MNDFDNSNFGTPSEPAPEKEEVKSEDIQQKEEPASAEVVFNSDGTYHGIPTENKESNFSSVATDFSSQENADNVNKNPYSASGTYPYERRTSPENEPPKNYQGVNNSGTYPYRTNSYPYGNQNNQGNQSNYGNYGDNRGYYQNNVTNSGYAYSDNNKNTGKKNSGKGTKIFATVAAALCVFLLFALIAVVAGNNKTVSVPENTTDVSASENTAELETSPSSETSNTGSTSGELIPKAIYNKVRASSVGILVYNNSKTLASEGTGVLFQQSDDAKFTYVVTCAHVINGSSGVIIVQMHDGKKYDATVVGYDARTDIGVLRIEASGLTLAEIGDSSKISVGDAVYAIGNPGGVEFANSFTNGIVSALDRPVNSSETGYTTECIQHTAAINPGNSGGALVNAFGQVIGINSMKIVADEYEGMGFAVPSSVFVEVVNEIMKNGYVSNRPKLGITYVAASEYSSYGMFVAIKGLPAGSIVIYEISSDSAFAGTDVKKGDMIVSVNGKGLDEASYLSEVIEESNVGDELTLEIIRIYEDYTFDEFEVTVKLVEDKGESFITEEETTQGYLFPDDSQGSGGNSGNYYEDFFNEYFKEFFGGNYPY